MTASEQSVILRDRRMLCENRVFNVYLDHLRDAGGSEVRDYLVVEPKRNTGDLVTGVSVLPILGDRIGLLHVYRHAVGRPVWELPRGFVDAGESDEQSAARELEEETGLGVHPGGMRSLGFITPEAGLLAARVHIFAAERCFQKRPYGPAEMGHQELRWFSRDEFAAMVDGSEIEDPSTLVAFYKCVLPGRP